MLRRWPRGAEATSEIIIGADVVSCHEPHESELAASFAYPGAAAGVPYPGDAVVTSYAEEACAFRFGSYVGKSYETSTLGMTYLYPLRVNWTTGDYSIQCVIHPPEGESTTTGSLRGSGR
jgi:hypothetical protein